MYVPDAVIGRSTVLSLNVSTCPFIRNRGIGVLTLEEGGQGQPEQQGGQPEQEQGGQQEGLAQEPEQERAGQQEAVRWASQCVCHFK